MPFRDNDTGSPGGDGADPYALSERIHNRLSIIEDLSRASAAAQLEALTKPDEPLRRSIVRAVLSRHYANLMNIVVIVNLAVVVIEADRGAHLRAIERAGQEVQLTFMDFVLRMFNRGFLGLYCFDVLIQYYVYRRRYFQDSMRTFDLAVVSVDFLAWLFEDLLTNMPSASVLRVFRLAKLVRAAKLVSGIQQLYMIISGFVGAMRALFSGMIVLAVLLLFWAVVCVEVIQVYSKELEELGEYPLCSRCPRAFDSVGDSILTLIQTTFVADSWGEVMVPIIEYHTWTAIPLILMYGTVNLGVLNLILSAVVESAEDRRQEDKEHQVLSKIKDAEGAKVRLKMICKAMDMDGSGALTYTEILDGYEHNREFFHTMELLDVGREEMAVIFRILDADKSGSVTYDEFVNALHKMATEKSHSILFFLKHSVADMHDKLQMQFCAIQDEIMLLSEVKDAMQSLARHELSAGVAAGNSCHRQCPEQSYFQDQDMRRPAVLAQHFPDMDIDGHRPQSPGFEGRFDPRCCDLQTGPEASTVDRSYACAAALYPRTEVLCSGHEHSPHTKGRQLLAVVNGRQRGREHSPPLGGREHSPPLGRRVHSSPLGFGGRNHSPPMRGPGPSGCGRGMVDAQARQRQQQMSPHGTQI